MYSTGDQSGTSGASAMSCLLRRTQRGRNRTASPKIFVRCPGWHAFAAPKSLATTSLPDGAAKAWHLSHAIIKDVDRRFNRHRRQVTNPAGNGEIGTLI